MYCGLKGKRECAIPLQLDIMHNKLYFSAKPFTAVCHNKTSEHYHVGMYPKDEKTKPLNALM